MADRITLLTPFLFLNTHDTFQIIFLTLFIIVAAFIAFIIFYLVKFKSNTNLKSKLLNYNTRVYTYNYETHTVYSFDKINLRNKKNYTLTEFMNEFSEKDQSLVRQWIKDIIETENNYRQFIEADLNISKNKKNEKKRRKKTNKNSVRALLVLTSVNRDKKLIHIESQILSYSSEHDIEKKNKYIKNHISDIKKLKCFSVSNLTKNKYPFTAYVVNIHATKDTASKNQISNEIQQLKLQLINQLVVILDNRTYITRLKENKIVILRLEEFNKKEVYATSNKILHICSRFIVLKSLNDYYDVSVGIEATHSLTLFNADSLDTVIKNAAEASKLAIGHLDKKYNSKVYWFSQTTTQKTVAYNIYSQLTPIVNNHLYTIYFQPIVNIENASVLFYKMSFTIDVPGIDKTMSDIFEVAYTFNTLEELLLKVVMSTYDSIVQDEEVSLLLNFKFKYLSQINILKFKLTDNDLILAFYESDLDNYTKEQLFTPLLSCVNSSIKLCLIRDDETYSLPNELLSLFSYFVIDKKFFVQLATNLRNQSVVQMMYTKLSIFNKPIISYGAQSIEAIKICHRFGLEYYGSNVIMKESKSVRTLSQDNKDLIIKTFR